MNSLLLAMVNTVKGVLGSVGTIWIMWNLDRDAVLWGMAAEG